jgi:hypothetical protein
MLRPLQFKNHVGVFTMLNFESLVARHGEIGVQAIIERIERNDGVRARGDVSLEERWEAVMNMAAPADRRGVA